MSDVIRRRADGSWGQGDDVPTYASDRAETWSGTRDESMEHVSDEYAKQLAAQKDWNLKEHIGKLYLQKECIDLLEENDALKKRIAKLERQMQEYKEENVRLLQQCLSIYRAVKKANCEMDKVEEKCEADVWFQRLKERKY
jgi:hypothetical protein